MIIKEFRVPLPLTVPEYQVAQLYTVAEMSKQETQGDSGVEVLKNEPFDSTTLGKGQYTHKVYHLGHRVPTWVRFLASENMLKLEEKAWNAYPYCKTVLSHPLLGERFELAIITWHKQDGGKTENIHNLSPEELAIRQIEFIDIANDPVDPKDYSEATDPTKVSLIRAGRGPLGKNWKQEMNPLMCCYKLVRIQFNVFGLQTKAENFISKFQHSLFFKFHRQLFCLMDKWFGLTMEDIRYLEAQAKDILDQKLTVDLANENSNVSKIHTRKVEQHNVTSSPSVEFPVKDTVGTDPAKNTHPRRRSSEGIHSSLSPSIAEQLNSRHPTDANVLKNGQSDVDISPGHYSNTPINSVVTRSTSGSLPITEYSTFDEL